MVTFRFKDFGENLGTRPLGKRVREQLLPMIEQNDCVVLDFTGVDVVSNSFADECIAKLLLVMSLSELKSRTTFRVMVSLHIIADFAVTKIISISKVVYLVLAQKLVV